ncbi:MAG: AAA family ATPase, partial [Candidatus Delongbacteria bacterium]|nr:AAA family ATPase [Candidatus Delongbacteria bacterium]
MSNTNKHSFLVAAPRSDSGKTLITLGLIKALCRKNKVVQPYKCGPDYIDPMHHSIVSGRPSYNLDTWMEKPHQVKNIFNTHLQNADIGIVEGVMGLFDGANKDIGSSAEIARLLSLPVILVV